MLRVLKAACARLCNERALISDWSFDQDITIGIQRKKDSFSGKNLREVFVEVFRVFLLQILRIWGFLKRLDA